MNLAIAAFLKPFAVVAFLALCWWIKWCIGRYFPDGWLKRVILKERHFSDLLAPLRRQRGAKYPARRSDLVE